MDKQLRQEIIVYFTTFIEVNNRQSCIDDAFFDVPKLKQQIDLNAASDSDFASHLFHILNRHGNLVTGADQGKHALIAMIEAVGNRMGGNAKSNGTSLVKKLRQLFIQNSDKDQSLIDTDPTPSRDDLDPKILEPMLDDDDQDSTMPQESDPKKEAKVGAEGHLGQPLESFEGNASLPSVGPHTPANSVAIQEAGIMPDESESTIPDQKQPVAEQREYKTGWLIINICLLPVTLFTPGLVLINISGDSADAIIQLLLAVLGVFVLVVLIILNRPSVRDVIEHEIKDFLDEPWVIGLQLMVIISCIIVLLVARSDGQPVPRIAVITNDNTELLSRSDGGELITLLDEGSVVMLLGRSNDNFSILIRSGEDTGWIRRDSVSMDGESQSLSIIDITATWLRDQRTVTAQTRTAIAMVNLNNTNTAHTQTAVASQWTPTPTVTSTPSNTPTNTPTATSTSSNTPTNTPTATSTSSNTPTNTPTPTVIPSNTPTSTPTPTVTPSNTPTNTLTPTITPNATATALFDITVPCEANMRCMATVFTQDELNDIFGTLIIDQGDAQQYCRLLDGELITVEQWQTASAMSGFDRASGIYEYTNTPGEANESYAVLHGVTKPTILREINQDSEIIAQTLPTSFRCVLPTP